MTANVTITNTGSTAVNGWTPGVQLPRRHQGRQRLERHGDPDSTAVRATNVSYNATTAPGGNLSFGFTCAWTTSDATPTGFTLNGAICAAG